MSFQVLTQDNVRVLLRFEKRRKNVRQKSLILSVSRPKKSSLQWKKIHPFFDPMNFLGENCDIFLAKIATSEFGFDIKILWLPEKFVIDPPHTGSIHRRKPARSPRMEFKKLSQMDARDCHWQSPRPGRGLLFPQQAVFVLQPPASFYGWICAKGKEK